MKILWRKRGFTTNSSGSYEWLPGQATSSATSTVSSTSTSALPTTTPINSNPGLASRFDLLILLAAILVGITSVTMLLKEMLGGNKKKKHVDHKKRQK